MEKKENTEMTMENSSFNLDEFAVCKEGCNRYLCLHGRMSLFRVAHQSTLKCLYRRQEHLMIIKLCLLQNVFMHALSSGRKKLNTP